MNKVTFKPSFSPQANFFFKVLPWVTIFSLIVVCLYFLSGIKSMNYLTWVFALPVIVASFWLFKFLYGWDINHRKITIENGQLVYTFNSLPWQDGNQQINLSNVTQITEGKSSQWAGRTAVISYTYNFTYRTGEQVKITMSAWDKLSLIALLNYIKTNFPQAKVNSELV